MNTLTEKTRLFQHFQPPTFVRVGHGSCEQQYGSRSGRIVFPSFRWWHLNLTADSRRLLVYLVVGEITPALILAQNAGN